MAFAASRRGNKSGGNQEESEDTLLGRRTESERIADHLDSAEFF